MEKKIIIRKLIFVFLTKLLILILVGGVALSFLGSKLKSQAYSLRERQTQIAIFQGKESSKADLEKNYKELEPNLPKIIGALPKKDDLTGFLLDLEKIAPSLSLRFEEKTPSPDLLSFEIKLPGNLVDFVNFIKSLEALPYLIKLTGFEITQQTATFKATLWISP